LIGILFILFGILLIILGGFIGISGENSKTNLAIGGFIGPIPFGFFTNKKMFWIFCILFLVSFLFWFLLRNKI